MFKDEFEGNWHQFKGKVQEKWGKFTHDDVTRMNGNYEQFLGQLQKKYGYSKEQAERELRTWCQSCQNKSHTNKDKETHNSWNDQKSNRNESTERNHPSKDQGFGKQDPWKSDEKNKNKNNDQDYRDKKRKAG